MKNAERQAVGASISKAVENPTLRVLSLGAGVQSTALAMMVARGDLPMLDFAVFADTKGEPARVYRHLDWLETQVPFPIIRASRDGDSLEEAALKIAAGEAPRGPMIPLHVANPKGMLPRQCSKEYKTRVVQGVIRRHLGLSQGQRAPADIRIEQWIGISWDEIQRMKSSELAFIQNRWPLIELGMDRDDCNRWSDERQLPRAPKSSCVYCPFRDDAAWLDMQINAPEDFAHAVRVDYGVRNGFPGMEGVAYIHPQRVPLDQVDFSRPRAKEDSGSFLDECEGICGI